MINTVDTNIGEFVGRTEILQHLTRRIAAYSQSSLLIGVRRIGKTSLLKHINSVGLSLKESTNVLYVYLDAKDFSLDNYSNTFWHEIYRLAVKAEDGMISTGNYSDNIFQELVEFTQRINKRVIILLDNFDFYLEAAKTNSDLRKIRQITDSELKKYLVFVATSSEEPSKVIERNKNLSLNESPFYNFAIDYLLPFTPKEVEIFAQKKFGGLHSEELSFAYTASGGHPELLQVTLEYLKQMSQTSSLGLDENGMKLIYNNLLIDERVNWLCRVLYEQLPASQKNIIKSILFERNRSNFETEEPAVLKLKMHVGIVRVEGDKIVLFSNLFASVLRNILEKEDTTEKTILDYAMKKQELESKSPSSTSFLFEKDTCTLRVNEQTIDLTSLECRLLAYLSEHNNQVCSIDDLLNNVWSPSRSKKVVERGINRLREKIEEDPTMPKRLLNVKGKGYILMV